MSEWINVKDMFPEETGYYLVIFPWRDTFSEGQVRVMHFLKTAYETPVNRWYDSDYQEKITHWMPLPAPPKK